MQNLAAKSALLCLAALSAVAFLMCFQGQRHQHAKFSGFLSRGAEQRRLLSNKTALDAQFLMQATFGPTEQSLKDFAELSDVEWIRDQMTLPVESHRVFYRQRVNPRFDESAIDLKMFSEKSRCDEGSRWHAYVFKSTDVGKQLKTKQGQLLIDSAWRSDVDPSSSTPQCSDEVDSRMARKGLTCSSNIKFTQKECGRPSWKAAKFCQHTCYHLGRGYKGDDCSGGWYKYSTKRLNVYICSVEEVLGGKVELSQAENCEAKIYMRNPAVFATDSVNAATIGLTFEQNPSLPDVIFLAKLTSSCDISKAAVILHEGKYYVHDHRMALQESTVDHPQTLDPEACPSKTFLNKDSCMLQPATFQGCPVACGSPGEVSNMGKEGHQFSMFTVDRKVEGSVGPDRNFDHGYDKQMPNSLVKTTVWTMMAMHAKDQLRQRTAWALSQILVVGTPGVTGENLYSEPMMNFYDIFVRHAFGNFRDILQEVTYNPIMGKYLTYHDSKSYDSSRSYPDENFAREIMQLFTIGVNKLHVNGSVITDSKNLPVPAYTNDNIMDFARVFTGFRQQPLRGNIEVNSRNNHIDPMKMIPGLHDKYPKPDLDHNYLGDGFPLCSDLPKNAFLAKGAKYEFLGYSYQGDVYAPSESSALYQVLMASALSVTLEDDLPCEGPGCGFETVGVVQAGNLFFEYIAPRCVHLFIYNGQSIRDRDFRKPTCVDPDSPVAEFACCSGCTDNPTGWMKRNAISCSNAESKWVNRKGSPTMFEKFCNKKKNWRKGKYCQLTCWNKNKNWDGKLAYANDDCSAGVYRETLQCDSQLKRVRLSTAKAQCERLGMSLCSAKPFGSCSDRKSYLWNEETCNMSVRVHADGKISAHTIYHQQNRFAVNWAADAVAPAGDYQAKVSLRQVFDATPSKVELMAKLKVGAFNPTIGCTQSCDGEVKAYTQRPHVFDQDTVFECEGRFYKNVESIVQLGDWSFRNPPVFVRPGLSGVDNTNGALERAALDEVESLIDHLFHHPNTAVNIGKKLIQRFVTSNPSHAYVEAVGNAFKTGIYDGSQYSGQYGDLGATIAAVLLHPEARAQSGEENGLLREPMLKLIHVMRSMKYEDRRRWPIIFKDLAEKIGQFPYKSPTVFNYYNHDFMPARFRDSEQGEPEPEPEPEPLVAPEFQIFTAPFMLNLLNGFTSLIEDDASADSFLSGKGKGGLTLTEAPTENETLDELNLLLTGGRLTPDGSQAVRAAYEKAEPADRLKMAEQAILLTPEFNNLGDPMPEGKRPIKVPAPAQDPEPYKAVVMLFLAGGADTFQMLVPLCSGLHDSYKTVRKGIEIPADDLLNITASTQKCKQFGINPAMPKLKKLYDSKEAAFVSNIGMLTEPTTKSMLKSGAAHSCKAQFSHSHAQAMAQTAQCAVSSTVPHGVGGLMADELGKKGMKTSSFSVSGIATWSQGQETDTEILDKGKGVVRFNAYDVWKDTVVNITSQHHGNIYCDSYAEAMAEAVASSERLGGFLKNVSSPSLENYTKETVLQKQLHQVARIIATHTERKAERDFFFVQLGGWDTHAAIKDVLPTKFKEVDDAIDGFVSELKNQTIFESVVLMTESDFGRTLSFNGAGTDHGWGGNHFIVGGGINGGEVYNDFIETYGDSEYMTSGRSRVIPKYPWESIMVPIAKWAGVEEESVLSKVFPNLANFDPSVHIIHNDTLFKQ